MTSNQTKLARVRLEIYKQKLREAERIFSDVDKNPKCEFEAMVYGEMIELFRAEVRASELALEMSEDD